VVAEAARDAHKTSACLKSGARRKTIQWSFRPGTSYLKCLIFNVSN